MGDDDHGDIIDGNLVGAPIIDILEHKSSEWLKEVGWRKRMVLLARLFSE